MYAVGNNTAGHKIEQNKTDLPLEALKEGSNIKLNLITGGLDTFGGMFSGFINQFS